MAGWMVLAGSAVLGSSGYAYWRRGKVQNALYPPPVESLSSEFLCPKAAHTSVILIGDSRVSRWTPLPEFSAGFAAVNRGLGGESLTSLHGRFAKDSLTCQPHAVVLQTGINDLVGASFLDSAQSDGICLATIDRFKAMAAESSVADVPLLIMTIIPPGRPTNLYRVEGVSHLSRLVARVNDALVKVNWPENVRLSDVREPLSDAGGLLLRREFQDDTLHLSASCYAVLNGILVKAMGST